MSWKLKRLRQCEKCPWKVSTNPHEIPDGYTRELHEGLASTIAEPGSLEGTGRAFACHESAPGEEVHCVGWLMNQIGPGNNIPLRLRVMDCENIGSVVLDGPQHECFEDTLPAEEVEEEDR